MTPEYQYIAIDEEGFPLFGELRVQDTQIGAEILSNIKFAENGAFETKYKDNQALVEPFDEPLVARQVLKTPAGWEIQAPYELKFSFDPKSLSLDEWDRFHGVTQQGVPFVFSRKAQAEFFHLLDSYDDDSITIDGQTLKVPSWLEPKTEIQLEQFWTQIYQTEEPRWELNKPTPALTDMLPRLKLPKSRILVMGCGSGNDAAFFAQQGHVVTAVDISPEAIARGQKKYADLKNITWLTSDLFALGSEHHQNYDLIFEHTCYCAIDPAKRNEIVALWNQLLAPGGHLLGVFFAMEKRKGPPFGGSEWELRERLKKTFRFIFWGRWHQSIDRRQGKELLVYAQKK